MFAIDDWNRQEDMNLFGVCALARQGRPLSQWSTKYKQCSNWKVLDTHIKFCVFCVSGLCVYYRFSTHYLQRYHRNGGKLHACSLFTTARFIA